jgi:hypothetical protein
MPVDGRSAHRTRGLMRRLAVILSLAMFLWAAASPASATHAADATVGGAPAIVAAQAVDQNDDSRVGVQVVVVAVAAGTVVGLGGAAYFLRRRLGLTKYDREAAEKALGQH